MKNQTRLFTIYLQYTSAHMAEGLEHLARLEKRLTGKGAHSRIVVDNALPAGERKVVEGVTLFGGDNTCHEFSGWETGWEILRERIEVTSDDVILLANDSFHRNYDPGIATLFTRSHFTDASAHRTITGILDVFPQPLTIQGRERTGWIRSNCFIINAGLLQDLMPLVFQQSPETLFSTVSDELFSNKSALEFHYREYLRVWLTGVPSPHVNMHQHWYKSSQLTPENHLMLKQKAFSILCEHGLSFRAVDAGAVLTDIAQKPKARKRSLISRIFARVKQGINR